MSKSNMLQSFVDENLGEVRVLLKENEVWFVATDVCKALQIGNTPQALSRLENYQRSTIIINDSREFVAGARSLNIINESGMWRLVFTSRKKEAKELCHWITCTVLPSIRKNGGYVEGQENLDPEELAALRKEISSLRKKVAKRDFRIASLESDVEELEDQVSILKKQEYANAYSLYSNEDY